MIRECLTNDQLIALAAQLLHVATQLLFQQTMSKYFHISWIYIAQNTLSQVYFSIDFKHMILSGEIQP